MLDYIRRLRQSMKARSAARKALVEAKKTKNPSLIRQANAMNNSAISWNKKMQNKVNANKAAEKQKWRNVYGNKNEPQYVN